MDGAVHDPPPLVSLALGVAFVVVLLGLTVLPFLTPAWFALAQERAGVAGLTGWSPEAVRRVTERLIGDVVLGPPRFDVAVDGTPVLGERERDHLRDVRAVLVRFGLAVVVAAVVVLVAKWRLSPAAFWAVAERTGVGVVVAVALVGLVALVAFDPLFELFHRLFFPPGTYTFDPARERLVQLFPMPLWFETAIAAGLVLAALGLLLATLGRRRRRVGEGGS
jgi:integral membrane protein (TIGR01906 family)